MLTLFTVPKPFGGVIGDIQQNAVASWRALHGHVQIVLLGDETGIADAARRAGVDHASGLVRNERGTPRLDSAFELVGGVARYPLWCLVNADIVLLDDFLPAVMRVAERFDTFLLAGECRDLPVPADAPLADRTFRNDLRKRALVDGKLRGAAALDYFVFPRGHFGELPPFLAGRAGFDNWLVRQARHRGPVVDATQSVVAIHQSHDYSHVPGGFEEAYYGEEAALNKRLAGGRAGIYTLYDATHRLRRGGRIERYWASTFHARETVRKTKARIDLRVAGGRRRAAASRPVRLVGVFPEPTPYRSPLLDRVARVEGVELCVLYAARSVAGRTWSFDRPCHDHRVLPGFRLPAAQRVLRHDYPVNYSIWTSLARQRPDCLVVSGWSTFAAQAAILWCIRRRVPYLLVVESHDRDPRSPWRRAIKGAFVPRVVTHAAGVLVAGSLARESMLARGADPRRVRIFANTVDVDDFRERAEKLAGDRHELRRVLGVAADDVVVLSVARLAPEKGLATLIRAVSQTEDERVALVVAGSGSEDKRLRSLAQELDVRLYLRGDVDWGRIVDLYSAADVFALLSESEPWGVVVNEAAASGLPLVLSDAVGAGYDLLVDGVNGRRVPAGDTAAVTAALVELARDPALRRSWGSASKARVAGWGYEPSVDGLVDLVQLATGRKLRR